MKISSVTLEPLEAVHDPVHHRPARHLEHRLGNEMGVRAEAGALAGERNDHLHAFESFWMAATGTTSRPHAVTYSSPEDHPAAGLNTNELG